MEHALKSHAAWSTALVELASERSSEKRLELLRRITHAYLEHPIDPTTAEQYLFNEIITKLVSKIEMTGKIEAAISLSKLPTIPETIVRSMAHDSDAAVAGPILRDYRGLSEKVLIEQAKNGSQDHLHAISGRPGIAPPVTDFVVTRGDEKTVRSLAANKGAQFSKMGMRTLIAKAAKDVDLRALIVERADLSIAAIGKLLPLISQELARRMHGIPIDFDESEMSHYVVDWMDNRGGNLAKVARFIDSIRKGDLMLEDVVRELLRAEHLLDTASVIAATADLDRLYACDLLMRGKQEATLLLLRAAELSWPAVAAFMKLRHAKMHGSDTKPTISRKEFEAMDVATAQRVVRFLKVRRAAMAAPA